MSDKLEFALDEAEKTIERLEREMYQERANDVIEIERLRGALESAARKMNMAIDTIDHALNPERCRPEFTWHGIVNLDRKEQYRRQRCKEEGDCACAVAEVPCKYEGEETQ